MKYIACLSVVLSFGITSPSVAQDSITLKNGDTLSGALRAQEGDVLTVTTSYGVLTIPVADVDSVNTKNKAVLALTNQEQKPIQNHVAYIEPAAAAGHGAQRQEPQEDRMWGAKWSGNANIGAELKTGNSENNGINADATIKARWSDAHRSRLRGEYDREEDDGDVTVDNRSIGFLHDYYFRPKWFWENEVEFEQDDIAKLDLRTTIASGIGYQVYERDDLNLSMVAGAGYLQENYESGQDDSSLIGEFSLDYDQKFYDDLFRTFHESDISVPADDTGAYIFESATGLRVPLRKGLIATGEVEFDWDNDPAPGTTEDDTTYSLKLGYEW